MVHYGCELNEEIISGPCICLRSLSWMGYNLGLLWKRQLSPTHTVCSIAQKKMFGLWCWYKQKWLEIVFTKTVRVKYYTS